MMGRRAWPASVLLLALALCGAAGAAAEGPPVFFTAPGFEADKCASVWLIRRFIAPEAEVLFRPAGEDLPGGIPFDLPEARFRRYHDRSTFETLAAHYRIADPGVRRVGEIIHDIEVNTWEEKRFPESRVVQERVLRIIEESRTDPERMERCLAYFESYLAAIPAGKRAP